MKYRVLIVFIALLALPNLASSYEYSYYEFRDIVFPGISGCEDSNFQQFEEKGCNHWLLEFFENYQRYKDVLKTEDFNNLFDNNTYLIKLTEKYFEWQENKLKENISRNSWSYYIGAAPPNDNDIYGLFLSKIKFIRFCTGFLTEDVCGERKQVVEDYKKILENAKIHYLSELEKGKDTQYISLRLATVGMHRTGQDNEIIHYTIQENQNYAKQNADESLQLQRKCVEVTHSVAKIFCAENAIKIADKFDDEIFGDQDNKENQLKKREFITHYAKQAADEINKYYYEYGDIKDKNEVIRLNKIAGESYYKFAALLYCSPETCSDRNPKVARTADENFMVADKFLLIGMKHLAIAEDKEQWENAFFLRKDILEKSQNKSFVDVFIFLLEASLVLLFISLFFIALRFSDKISEKIEKLEKESPLLEALFNINKKINGFLSFGEKNSKFLLTLSVTVWIGLIFASTLGIQFNEAQRDILSIPDLTMRMNYIGDLEKSVNNEIFFNFAWTFMSIGIFCLMLSMILRQYKDQFSQRILFVFYLIASIMTTYSVFHILAFESETFLLSVVVITISGIYLALSSQDVNIKELKQKIISNLNPLKTFLKEILNKIKTKVVSLKDYFILNLKRMFAYLKEKLHKIKMKFIILKNSLIFNIKKIIYGKKRL